MTPEGDEAIDHPNLGRTAHLYKNANKWTVATPALGIVKSSTLTEVYGLSISPSGQVNYIKLQNPKTINRSKN